MRRTVVTQTERFYEIPEDSSPQVRWLVNILNEFNLTCAGLAKKIFVSRETVILWVKKQTRITYGNLCAIVRELGLHDDPKKLYFLFRNQNNADNEESK